MIYDVFLPFLIIFSIFAIIIILARKIPTISLDAESINDARNSRKPQPHLPAAVFCLVLAASEKVLRQIRIHILKLDAKIFSLIEYLRRESAKKLSEIEKISYKKIAHDALEENAGKISFKVQSKIRERKLLHIIAKNPKEAGNYKKLGELYLENKNFPDALDSFKEYLKLNPTDAETEKLVGELEAGKKVS